MSFIRNPGSTVPDKLILPSKCRPSQVIFSISTLFKKCTTIKNLERIHAHIIRNGVEQDNLLVTQLVTLCNSFRIIKYARDVFFQTSQPNIYLWNAILKGYCEYCSFRDAILLFKRMKQTSIVPDHYTFPSLLKACSNESALDVGKEIHCSIVKSGVEIDMFVQTGLIDLYGKCREIKSARKLFDEMPERNVVSWTAIIVGYFNVSNVGTAQELFDRMPVRNLASWNAMIAGYAKCGDLRLARQLLDEMPERNAVSFTLLIDGYAKGGDMASARFLFDQLLDKDVVSWSALISGYAQNGQPNEVFKIFQQMQTKNVKPDEFIMVSLMSACSQLGRSDLAKWVDSFVARNRMDLRYQVVAALINMHVKCGNMDRATQLFEDMPWKDLFSYCSMIHGFSIHGFGTKAIGLFSKMLEEGLKPDCAAFTVVLSACSHAGLVEDGCRYFECMTKDFSIIPSADHYACMVDLLGRAGRLKEAYELIKSMPVEPHAGAWGALLNACKLHCDIELGEIVADRLFDIEPQNAGTYVSLSNIYAAADRWSDVLEVRRKMKERGVRKIPGQSTI